jgi:hypothetical protein
MANWVEKWALISNNDLPTSIEHILREIVTLKYGENNLTDLDHYPLPS